MRNIFKKICEKIQERDDRERILSEKVLGILDRQFRSGNGAYSNCTQDVIDDDFKLIEKYREWLKTQTDKDVVRQYRSWLNFYEGRAKEAQEDLPKKNKQDTLRRTISVPKPNF